LGKKDTHRSRNRSRSSTECGEANQYFANLYKRREEKRDQAQKPVSNAAEVPAYISIHHTDLSLYSSATNEREISARYTQPALFIIFLVKT
jgi:hypothetical protein